MLQAVRHIVLDVAKRKFCSPAIGPCMEAEVSRRFSPYHDETWMAYLHCALHPWGGSAHCTGHFMNDKDQTWCHDVVVQLFLHLRGCFGTVLDVSCLTDMFLICFCPALFLTCFKVYCGVVHSTYFVVRRSLSDLFHILYIVVRCPCSRYFVLRRSVSDLKWLKLVWGRHDSVKYMATLFGCPRGNT